MESLEKIAKAVVVVLHGGGTRSRQQGLLHEGFELIGSCLLNSQQNGLRPPR